MSKSLFIAAYSALVVVASGWAIYELVAVGLTWAWVGALLASAPFAIYLARGYLLRDQARTSARVPLIGFASFAGFVLSVVAWTLEGSAAIPAVVVAGSSAAGYFPYAFWYSVFGREHAVALEVGKQLPDFVLEDGEGKEVQSATLRDGPALLLFYRGNWCPLCFAQVKEIAALYKEMDARGVQVCLVSPQPHGNSVALARRFDVPFRFLVDPKNRAAKQLGIIDRYGVPAGFQALGYDSDTVLPTVVITNADGEIIFLDETDNYRVRPEPETFLKVLDAHL